MGARGPLKLPSHLRPVTDGKYAGTAAESVVRSAPAKTAAVESNPELGALWDVIVPELDRSGLLCPADGPTVELALRHYLIAARAADKVGDDVTVMALGDGGEKKNPAEAVFRLESDMFLRYADKLGMTFVSRARTPAARGRDDGESNPFADASGV